MHRPRGRRLSVRAGASPEGVLWQRRGWGWGSAIVAAVLVSIFAPQWLLGRERFVAAWSAFAFVLLAVIWLGAMSQDPAQTRRRAAANDPGRYVVLFVSVVACCIGFIASVGVLGRNPADAAHPALVITLAILAITLSWALIHTAMTLHYAHLYYRDDAAVGGLIFPETTDPCDTDFAYYAFTIGMTFQTSDVAVTYPSIRRFTLVHGIISFAFNVAIIAVAVNIATGLLH